MRMNSEQKLDVRERKVTRFSELTNEQFQYRFKVVESYKKKKKLKETIFKTIWSRFGE